MRYLLNSYFLIITLLSESHSASAHVPTFEMTYVGDTNLSGVATHSKAVFCLIDPNFMIFRDMNVEDIPMDLCTHIVIETTYQNYTVDFFQGLEKSSAPEQVRQFNKRLQRQRQKINHKSKFVLGLNNYKRSRQLLELLSGKNRNTDAFITAIVAFLRKHSYDGVNIEMTPNSKLLRIDTNQTFIFIREFNAKLKRYNLSLLLTLLEPPSELMNHLNWEQLKDHFDYLILRFFPGYLPKDNKPTPTVILQGADNSVARVVTNAIEKNIPSYKIVIGIPTYNMKFEIEKRNISNSMGDKVGSGEVVYPTYPEVCTIVLSERNQWSFHYNDSEAYTVLKKGPSWIAFTSVMTIRDYAYFALRVNLGGIAVWGLLDDDFMGHHCDPKLNTTFPLTRTVNFVFSTEQNVHKYNKAQSPTLIYGGAGFLLVVFVTATSFAAVVWKKNRLKAGILLSEHEVNRFYSGTESLLSIELAEFNETLDIGTTAMEHFRYDTSKEIGDSDFTICRQEILGCGTYGTVFKGTIGNETVAVKTMNIFPNAQGGVKSFLDEIRLMCYLGKHDHILSLIGANTSGLQTGRVFAFTEFCSHGSLKNVLISARKGFESLNNTNSKELPSLSSYFEPANVETSIKVTSEYLFLWSLQISRGMEYLSERSVIHGDLAARNVLVSSQRCVKISDFGLSRKLYEYCVYNKQKKGPLPWRWMAIESLRDLEFSEKSDVWAYGVTLWEIFSLAELPYADMPWSVGFVKELMDGLRLMMPQYSTPKIYKLMTDCWTFAPSDRPDFKKISQNVGDFQSKQ